MLDIKNIVKNEDAVIENLNRRGVDYTDEIKKIVELYHEYVNILKTEETLKAELNKKSKDIGRVKAEGGDIESILGEVEGLKSQIHSLDSRTLKEEYESRLLYIPNLIDSTVPFGKDENDNIEIKRWGEIPEFEFQPKEHFEIETVKEDFLFQKAAQITKSRFVITTNFVAKLERALSNFMLDLHGEHGYEEVNVPYIISADSFENSGQLPKFKYDAFKIDNNTKEQIDENEDDEVTNSKKEFYLISTAEAILANLHQNEIIPAGSLPMHYTAYSQCFRKEVGSAGKDVTGIIRMHQFGKVELFKYVEPESSMIELDIIVLDAERVLQELELPYRVVELCTGDIGFTASKTYDLEVWFPGQNTYRECSSCSTVGDYQARRGNIRYKTRDGKNELPHMLNGSGMATGRILAAILENYQKEDGTVEVPTKLLPYFR